MAWRLRTLAGGGGGVDTPPVVAGLDGLRDLLWGPGQAGPAPVLPPQPHLPGPWSHLCLETGSPGFCVRSRRHTARGWAARPAAAQRGAGPLRPALPWPSPLPSVPSLETDSQMQANACTCSPPSPSTPRDTRAPVPFRLGPGLSAPPPRMRSPPEPLQAAASSLAASRGLVHKSPRPETRKGLCISLPSCVALLFTGRPGVPLGVFIVRVSQAPNLIVFTWEASSVGHSTFCVVTLPRVAFLDFLFYPPGISPRAKNTLFYSPSFYPKS